MHALFYLIHVTYTAHMLESIGVHGTNLLELVDTQLDLVDNQLLMSEHGNRGGGNGGSGSNKRNRKKNSNLKSLLSLNPFKTPGQQQQGQQGKSTRSQRASSSVNIGAAVTTTNPLHPQHPQQQQDGERHDYVKVPTSAAAVEHPSITSTTTPAHTEDAYYGPLTGDSLSPHPQSHTLPDAHIKESKEIEEGKDSPERGDESEGQDDRFSRTSSFQSLASSQVHTDDYLPRTSISGGGGMGSGMGSGSKSVLRYRANTRGERVGAEEGNSGSGAGGVLDGSRAALDNSSRLFLENAKIGEIICI